MDDVKVLKDGTLVIRSAGQSDVGSYQCQAGTGQRAIESRKARVRLYRGRAKPIILRSPVETEVEKGDSITLECVASGFPRPFFAWYKDGGRLSTAHSRYKVLNEKNMSGPTFSFIFRSKTMEHWSSPMLN